MGTTLQQRQTAKTYRFKVAIMGALKTFDALVCKSFNVQPSMWAAAQREASMQGISMSQYLRNLLKAAADGKVNIAIRK